jgi:hypothetical protein
MRTIILTAITALGIGLISAPASAVPLNTTAIGDAARATSPVTKAYCRVHHWCEHGRCWRHRQCWSKIER